MPEHIFDRGDHAGREVFVAGPLARGPWDPRHCHGGAPAALLAALVDAAPAPVAMLTTRLTYDLVRPVPIGEPLHAGIEVRREGRRVQLLDLTLGDRSGTPYVRTRALRIRAGEVAVPQDATVDAPPPMPGPDELTRFVGDGAFAGGGFWDAVDIRLASGTPLGEQGPGTAWFRVVAPLAPQLTLTPLARAAAAADFGNGIGPPLPLGPYLFINPDLNLSLHRLPEGAWVALEARSVAQPSGVGLATSVLSDTRGRIGAASQSLLVDVR